MKLAIDTARQCGSSRAGPIDTASTGKLRLAYRQVSHSLPILLAVADVYQALADPTRRKILDELTERDGQTLFEICARLAMKHQLTSSRQAVSQHLDVLEGAGLVVSRREGRYKFHHLDREPLEHIADRWLKPDPHRRSDENPRD
jgi:DNA-binding transcriptional ArsR family regulator